MCAGRGEFQWHLSSVCVVAKHTYYLVNLSPSPPPCCPSTIPPPWWRQRRFGCVVGGESCNGTWVVLVLVQNTYLVTLSCSPSPCCPSIISQPSLPSSPSYRLLRSAEIYYQCNVCTSNRAEQIPELHMLDTETSPVYLCFACYIFGINHLHSVGYLFCTRSRVSLLGLHGYNNDHVLHSKPTHHSPQICTVFCLPSNFFSPRPLCPELTFPQLCL